MTATQSRDDDSGSAVRSIRKSSSVGFGELIGNGRSKETLFLASGQFSSAGRTKVTVFSVKPVLSVVKLVLS
jgi:hypothetical protein